ncbi:transmembrane protein [Nitzschia inconspicua]|uniref:Transmembrane protein n=1 Tax=Nitzschia inconspicua TaxID=303405 RepID=A0A9K3LTQ9_9STRA|nr:transmembrane protein [Nitzschia inconspicua]
MAIAYCKSGPVVALVLSLVLSILDHAKAGAVPTRSEIHPKNDVSPSDINVHFDNPFRGEFAGEFLDAYEGIDGIETDDLFSFLRKKPDVSSEQQQQEQQRRKTQQQTTTQVNIFQKLGESIGMTIVGCLLIAFMPCLIWRNEGRHVNELARIDFCKNNAVAVNCNTPTDENVGRLVHFTGNVTVGDTMLDLGDKEGALNVAKPVPNALVLKRTCYIWQKFEYATQSTQKNVVGGGETRTTTYHLREDWTAGGPQPRCPHLNENNSRGVWDQIMSITGGPHGTTGIPPIEDKAVGNQPSPVMNQQQTDPTQVEMAPLFFGVADPKKPPHAMNLSQVARVGEFYLSEKAMTSNPAVFLFGAIPVPSEYIPEYVSGCEDLQKGNDNALRTFPEGQEPRNGDCKVVYEYVPAGFDASFVVAQTAGVPDEAKKFGAKYGIDRAPVTGRCNHDLGQIWMVRKGTYNLYEMLEMAKAEENTLTMIIRVVVWALLCAGWVMLFSPFLTALEVLPLLSQLGYFAVVLVALIVSCLCCCTVMIFAYMRYRPGITAGLLVIALGIWGIVVWRLDIAAETGGDTPVPTSAPAISP